VLAAHTHRAIRYGPFPAQEGDLHLPAASRPPVVCLLHGGFWRMPHGRDQLDAVAEDLAARGYAVWNIGYRRLGAPGGGWPGTFEDVALAVDHLASLVDERVALDLDRVVVAGHSAGGQLALRVAARSARADVPSPRRVRVLAVAGLAPMADLKEAAARNSGRGAAREFLGGAPDAVPERYAAASPRERLPLGVPQLVLHGALDEALPVGLSRDYAAAARASGDEVELVELPGAGHMDFVDPATAAHAELCRWLARVTGKAAAQGRPA
jgi:acetyl esterase/lipase